MRKFLLLFLALGFGVMVNAQKKPYNNLIITEARYSATSFNYFELTNRGDETIDLSEFKFGSIGPWTVPWNLDPINSLMQLPKVMLAPGKSYVLATAWDAEPLRWALDNPGSSSDYSANYLRPWVQPREMMELADYLAHMPESGKPAVKDSVTPTYHAIGHGDGIYCFYLKHIYMINDVLDSMIIDQVGGIFDEEDGTNSIEPYDVAGFKDATDKCILIRRASVTSGITEFSSHAANDEAAKQQFRNNRGLDLGDSEWIPVPYLGDKYQGFRRAIFWTVGNHGDYKLNSTTLVSKIPGEIKVDYAKATITVPWGISYNDSIMNHFVRKPGIAWEYEYAPTREDSMYTSIRNGDKLKLYVCGNEVMMKTFTFIVSDPTPSDNFVLTRSNFYAYDWGNYRAEARFEVTSGIPGMDTIRGIDFGTRVDTLYEYLEKAPKASWKIIPKSGLNKAEVSYGDKLEVTSENGKVKEYFLKVMNYIPSVNARLASITWPDMPSDFKGEIAALYGWKGDTIPGFSPGNNTYILNIPLLMEYEGIPALVCSKENLNSTVVVNRAKTLDGSLEEATMAFTVTAEDGTQVNVYTVRFSKEKDPDNIQPFIAEPFISQVQSKDRWYYSWVEIVNPGTEPLDLSHYMIASGYLGDVLSLFNAYNLPANHRYAYRKYVPGRKWQDEANWNVQPRILEQDIATNSIVAPGDVFVMAALDLNGPGFSPGQVHWFADQIDFNFSDTPWGENLGYGSRTPMLVGGNTGQTLLFKILNDSVINGLKPATDLLDFQLIDVIGSGKEELWVVGGTAVYPNMCGLTRRPNVYKGNPEFSGSFGTNEDDSEWIYVDANVMKAKGYTSYPDYQWHQLDGIGSHVMDPVSVHKSTVTSSKYKVSPGFSQAETIRGLGTGTTLTDFYGNLIKANPLQTLKVKSAATGNPLDETSVISSGDKLIVLSADSMNTSTYILDVAPLSSNAMLTSAVYTIDVSGTTGTVSGFEIGIPLKTVVDNVVVPVGAAFTIIDQKDAYMSLVKLNYDTAYVDVIATDRIYFEVIAENGINKIVYQLQPTSSPSDAYVTSDLYSVDQSASLIQFIPGGTTAPILLSNVTPAKGATTAIYDKYGFVREAGAIYRDDKLVVTSKDGTVNKVYYFSMLNYFVNTYLAYVVSDDYQVDQLALKIVGPTTATPLSEFIGKLYPSFGATLKVFDTNGVEITGKLSKGAILVVTAANGVTTATYNIDVQIPDAVVAPFAEKIKVYPNPTSDRVIILGLEKGNRVQVFNAVGITLRDVIVDNSTEYVSLSAQPAGMYHFVIASGDKILYVQKIIKK